MNHSAHCLEILSLLVSILIGLVSSQSESDTTNVPIFILPLNVCNSPGKTIHKFHATGNNLNYSIIDAENYNFLKMSDGKLVLTGKAEKENVTIKIVVTSSTMTTASSSSVPPEDSLLTRTSLSVSLSRRPVVNRYRSLSSSAPFSNLLSSTNSINYNTLSNEIILQLNISSAYCSITSTEDEWRATRAVIVSLSVILILLLTLLSLTLICVWRREKRRKMHNAVSRAVNVSSGNNPDPLSWKERTRRKISWKEEDDDCEREEEDERRGVKKYFASFSLFPAKSRKKNSSQEVVVVVGDCDEELNCSTNNSSSNRSQARSKPTISIVNGISRSSDSVTTAGTTMTSVMSPEGNVMSNLPRKSSLKPPSGSNKINLDHKDKKLDGSSSAYENEGFDSENSKNNNNNDDSEEEDRDSIGSGTKERSFKANTGSSTSPTTGRRKSVVTFNDNTQVFQFSPNKKK